MTQGDQLTGLLGGHDAGDAGDPQHVAFFCAAAFDDGQGGWQHFDAPARNADALRVRLVRHVHHVGLTLGVKMGK